MNPLTRGLASILEASLPQRYTSISYAIAREGELIAEDALGNQGGQEKKPVTLDCTYNVASVSKVYCAAAVMQLAGQGRLELDRPVAEYLPRFQMADPRYRQITLRHCLSHTSGLPGTQWRGFSVTATGGDYYADVYDYLSRSTLKAAPGEYAVYCNDGFTLAEMVLARVTGQDYGDYVVEHIARPLGAESTRFASNLNPRCPLIREGNKPAELLLIRGGAGITTTMADLVKFGQVFLEDSPVLSRELAREMARPQGRTFLKADGKSPLYGLGWDSVSLSDAGYDLPPGVLYKGGNSFQFSSAFIVMPELKVAAALSETHDCRLNPELTLLRLISEALAFRKKAFLRRSRPIPPALRAFEGFYLTPGAALRLTLHSASADLEWRFADGSKSLLSGGLLWNGRHLATPDGQEEFFFEEARGETFLIHRLRGMELPMAQKARSFPKNDAWEKRTGTAWLVCDADVNDLVIGENMTAFRIWGLPETEGVYRLSFVQRADSGVYSHFDAPVRALDDWRGQGFLITPANPSRDRLDPRFFTEEGLEYCDAASYRYRNAQDLPAYDGQPFPERRRQNGLYRLERRLDELPAVPPGHRILILNDGLRPHFDSLSQQPAEFLPLDQGFIILM